MNTNTLARLAAMAVLAVTLALTAAACGSKSHDAGAGAVTSFTANPTVSTELNQAEQALLSNIQANFSALHPVKSVKAGVAATYPHGSTSKIVNYAVRTFKVAVIHPLHGRNPARDAWLLGVTNYAQSLGATPAVSPSPGVGTSTAQPSIPGTTTSGSPA